MSCLPVRAGPSNQWAADEECREQSFCSAPCMGLRSNHHHCPKKGQPLEKLQRGRKSRPANKQLDQPSTQQPAATC